MNNQDVKRAVEKAVAGAVNVYVYRDVNWAVNGAMYHAVNRAVDWTVNRAVYEEAVNLNVDETVDVAVSDTTPNHWNLWDDV